jgi:hypothetical protein
MLVALEELDRRAARFNATLSLAPAMRQANRSLGGCLYLPKAVAGAGGEESGVKSHGPVDLAVHLRIRVAYDPRHGARAGHEITTGNFPRKPASQAVGGLTQDEQMFHNTRSNSVRFALAARLAFSIVASSPLCEETSPQQQRPSVSVRTALRYLRSGGLQRCAWQVHHGHSGGT